MGRVHDVHEMRILPSATRKGHGDWERPTPTWYVMTGQKRKTWQLTWWQAGLSMNVRIKQSNCTSTTMDAENLFVWQWHSQYQFYWQSNQLLMAFFQIFSKWKSFDVKLRFLLLKWKLFCALTQKEGRQLSFRTCY